MASVQVKAPASEFVLFSLPFTGNLAILLNDEDIFPQDVIFFTGARLGQNETRRFISVGMTDFLNEKASSGYADSGQRITRDSTNYSMLHHNDISSVITKVLDFDVTGRDFGEIDINVGTLHTQGSDFPIMGLVRGYKLETVQVDE